MPGFDEGADMALKKAGNELHAHLVSLFCKLNHQEANWTSEGWATRIEEVTFGFVPRGDGPNKASDAEVRALIPQVEGALNIVQGILKNL